MQGRFSFYREVHKGIRSLLLDLVVKSGRIDWTDNLSVATFRLDVQNAFALLSAHAEHENEFIAPLLAVASRPAGEVFDSAHDDQEVTLHDLLVALHAIDPEAGDASTRGHEFVVKLSRLAGELLTHMADEEEIAMPAMWSVYDDAALLAVDQQLVASISPDRMAAYLKWMLPAMNTPERVDMLAAMQKDAPAEVYQFVRELAREVLSRADDVALERGLSAALLPTV